ncbi:MAG: hypothetical protein NVS3B26_18820 [Mycobacteriales bacterium]
MLTNGVFYQDLGGDFYARRNPDKTKQRALDQLRQMGYTVALTPTTDRCGGVNLLSRDRSGVRADAARQRLT